MQLFLRNGKYHSYFYLKNNFNGEPYALTIYILSEYTKYIERKPSYECCS